jgi:hypothetical protein
MEILTPTQLSATTGGRVPILRLTARTKGPAPPKMRRRFDCCFWTRPSYSDVTISFSVLLGRSAAEAFTSSG